MDREAVHLADIVFNRNSHLLPLPLENVYLHTVDLRISPDSPYFLTW